MTMIVCGVDPGRTIGYALLGLEDGRLRKIESGTVKGFKGVKYLLALPADVWAIESFTLWPNMARQVANNDPDLLTTQYIGALKISLPPDRRSLQPPTCKQYCTNNVLRRLGLWETGQSPHERDAMRHVVFYLRKELRLATGKGSKGAKARFRNHLAGVGSRPNRYSGGTAF